MEVPSQLVIFNFEWWEEGFDERLDDFGLKIISSTSKLLED